jgi:hypothetical protein
LNDLGFIQPAYGHWITGREPGLAYSYVMNPLRLITIEIQELIDREPGTAHFFLVSGVFLFFCVFKMLEK